jgi:hypothetical protein
MNCNRPFLTVLSVLLFFSLHAQQHPDKCGTIQYLNKKLQQNSVARTRYEQKRIEFNKMVSSRGFNNTARLGGTVYIPVVFHIVLPNPNIVTDEQIQAQLDTLNRDFFGSNGDSVNIPSYFKPLYGKSNIQFCLAQRTPDGDATDGIERVVTSTSAFTIDDAVKHNYSGGSDSWNTAKYFNVWVCVLSNTLLGYSTMPNSGTAAADEGVVIEYRSLPGGSFSNFSAGKTLTHETGHFFNLYHIWGNNSSGCSDGDDVDDTPNQNGSTSGCLSGIKTDNCTTGGNGIMYQNYMDYSDDACLVMFTPGQVDRMETALQTYRSSLLTSNGCLPVVLNNYDVQLRSVTQPPHRLCNTTFTPQVSIKNRGAINLTSLQITTSVDNGTPTSYQWTGSVSTSGITTINLNSLTVTPGIHTLTVYISNPNSATDQDRTNDTLQMNFEYFPPISFTSPFVSSPFTELKEGFEGSTFPPTGWDIINPDNAFTWERVSGISKTGNASVRVSNFNYDHIGENDDLRMPTVTIPAGIDSAFLSFEVAAAAFSDLTTPSNNWDTLQVLISTDCGKTYTSLYKKWGKSLVTTTLPTTSEFIPTSSQWRKDSIDLAPYIGGSELLIAFRNSSGFENDVYLDDINLRTVTVLPKLKELGFLVTPNPTNGAVAVRFYPQPTNLRGVQLFNDIGQKISEVQVIDGQANNYYSFDLTAHPKGMYIVRAVFTDRVITKKILKQ